MVLVVGSSSPSQRPSLVWTQGAQHGMSVEMRVGGVSVQFRVTVNDGDDDEEVVSMLFRESVGDVGGDEGEVEIVGRSV
jgi:hypothetical protein